MASSTSLKNQPEDPRLATLQELELAQQGDARAIATLMNRLLHTQGTTAQVERQGDRLIITLTAATTPSQASSVEFIRNGLVKLQPAGISQVQILGQAPAATTPDWSTTLQLQPESTPTQPLVEPPEPEFTTVVPVATPPQARPQISANLIKRLLSGAAILTTVVFCFGVILYALQQLANPTAVSQQSSVLGKTNRTINLTTNQQSKLVLTGVTWKANKNKQYNLVGTLRNNAGQLYTYVKIEFELYDSFGTRVGDAMAIVENLGAFQTKSFEALVVNPGAVQAKLKKITGY